MNYKRPETITTKLHHYKFMIDDEEQRKAYADFKAELKHTPGRGHWMNCLGHPSDKSKECPAGPVTLETRHPFNNQWNTAEGFRVFDWYEPIFPNKHVKRGHYLDIAPQMIELRQRVLCCGYCGHNRDNSTDDGFCPACWDSEYLKQGELHLLRLVPAADSFGAKRPELTDEERAVMLPRFKHAQIHGNTERGKARVKKQRADIQAKRDRTHENADAQADGLLWLLDRGISIDNAIYYSHTARFAFGWRKPLSFDIEQEMKQQLDGFPYPYDLKTE